MSDNDKLIALAKLDDIIICEWCNHAIDPDCCHCGDLIKAHGWGSGHSPVPQGCTCGYIESEKMKSNVPDCPPYLTSYDAIIALFKKQDRKIRLAVVVKLGATYGAISLDASPSEIADALLEELNLYVSKN